jgi:hypothetical protein
MRPRPEREHSVYPYHEPQATDLRPIIKGRIEEESLMSRVKIPATFQKATSVPCHAGFREASVAGTGRIRPAEPQRAPARTAGSVISLPQGGARSPASGRSSVRTRPFDSRSAEQLKARRLAVAAAGIAYFVEIP